MNCQFFEPDLKAYIDNELPFIRRYVVSQHIRHCGACGQEIKIMKNISNRLNMTENVEPISDSLRSRILTQATEIGAPSIGQSAVKPLNTKKPWSPALVGALCAAAAIVSYVVISPRLVSLYPSSSDSLQSTSQSNKAAWTQPVAPSAAFMNAAKNTGGQLPTSPLPGQSIMMQPKAHLDAPDSSFTASVPQLQTLDRQVHRDASLTVQTKDPESASQTVTQIVKSAGGFVASNDLTTDGSGMQSAQMSVNVPVIQFDTVVTQFEKLGSVTAKHVTGEDITAKISDAGQTESVLETDVQQSDAHLAALGRHAKWQDQEDARNLRIELAEARGREQLLNKLAQLSDIALTITQTPKPVPPIQTGMWSDLHNNTSQAVLSALGSLTSVLSILIWCVAYVPIWGPVAFGAWYANRRWRLSQRI